MSALGLVPFDSVSRAHEIEICLSILTVRLWQSKVIYELVIRISFKCWLLVARVIRLDIFILIFEKKNPKKTYFPFY